MNPRDVWFVGLLALAYLYLDASGPEGRREVLTREGALAPLEDDPFHEAPGAAIADGCPRDLTHPVSLRGDGAKWCLSCDEAFYPALA